ncbi:hypothetical protein HOC01_00800 [archaeon]|jgi:hypothetical protein|nr:hypothetical protein [archaeon]MBT6698620.1 hypothetical protein [archaeon]
MGLVDVLKLARVAPLFAASAFIASISHPNFNFSVSDSHVLSKLVDTDLEVYCEAAPEPIVDLSECAQPTYNPKKTKLSRTLNTEIDRLRDEGKFFADERVFAVAYDHNNGTFLADIRGDELMQVASMVKTLVGIAYLTKEASGELIDADQNSDYLELGKMILFSNNRSTNELIRKVGGPQEVERIAKEYGLKDVSIVEYIPTKGKMKGRTYKNKASPKDLIKALDLLRKGDVPNSDLLWELLYDSRGKRISNLKDYPGEQTFSKTGSTGMLIGDMGTVVYQDLNGEYNSVSLVIGVERDRRISDKYYSGWKKGRGDRVKDLARLTLDKIRTKSHVFSDYCL